MHGFLGGAITVVVALLLTGCVTSRSLTKAPSHANLAATVEGSDLRLRDALLAEAIAPTAHSHLEVAREYARLGILDVAHSRTTRALSLQPGSAAAHEFMARIWRDWGLASRGLGPAYRAVAFAPQSASARNTLGTIFDALGWEAEARIAYEAAATLDPQASWALNNLCYLELRQGRFEEARRQCEAALQMTPSLTAALNNLGLTHAAAGDMRGANLAFLAAGDDAAAHFNMGIVLLAARRYREAALAFEQAIDVRPGFTAAKRWAHDARMRALPFDKDHHE